MAQSRLLKNAPIKEAVIDVQIKASKETSVEKLTTLQGSLPSNYSELLPSIHRGVGVELKASGISTSTNEELIGYRSTCETRHYVAHFHAGGFSLSKLAPYTNWNEFQQEARVLWDSYQKLIGDYEITRVATRFINEIELPLGEEIRLEDYLVNSPNPPENMGNNITDFFTRVVVPQPDLQATAVVIQNLDSRRDEYLPVILDIDVFKSPAMCDNHTLWTLLDSLRDIKNLAFFGSVTDLALERYA